MYSEDLHNILEMIEALESNDVVLQVASEEPIDVHLFIKEEFKDGQIGYRVDEDGNSLLGEDEGDWIDDWHVIGYDEEIGDPIFVDITKVDYPVYTAAHGEGDWEPELLFESMSDFLNHVKPRE
ncbi:hypothetical protein GCM10008967_18430 [Bacillus carboniphilus]|uniref:Uncharacterized protein n=1 Tax=Bacillus carboniphilus TaxID=86663 RepID=A0ABP3FY27_9BACI